MELNNISLNSKKPFQRKTKKKNEKGEFRPVGNHIQMITRKAIHSRVSSHSGRYSWREDLSAQLKSAMKEWNVVCLAVFSSNDALRLSSANKKYVKQPIKYQFSYSNIMINLTSSFYEKAIGWRYTYSTCVMRNFVHLSSSLPLALDKISSNMSPFIFSMTTNTYKIS